MASSSPRDPSVRARRRGLLVSAVLVIAAGLVTHFVGSGPTADFAGDALYAVMIYLVISIAFPRAAFWIVGATALALCTLIECLQLTGLPALWAQTFWPVRLVLGVGFDVRDLVAYAVGAGAATLVDVTLSRRRRARV
ncbi:DUF2809 domain-containing protein [Microbacterium sp. APC 3901]|uniref:ribosomal maturation YjgA family protein n=1 Tax=Microbacterium sp. APC 3901 TaxID=3035192 RepID=UPI0025B373FF|nr:DUF2809 domain-containing protein [Microbacterium sp. APC 3901]MDN3443590.1 DUF2809 domain-containing protein [Microbacterium sp. APC 3901]